MGDKKYDYEQLKKLASDMTRELMKTTKRIKKNGVSCPNCEEELWKRRDGDFTCPNPSCSRDLIPREELAAKMMRQNFFG